MGEVPELLERAIATWDELAASGAPREIVDESRARLEEVLGDTLLRLGRAADAREVYQSFVDRFAELRRTSPSSPEWTFQLGSGLADLAVTFEQEGREEEAIAVLLDAQELLEPLVSDPEVGPKSRSVLVLVEATRGKHYRSMGRYEESESVLRRAIESAERLLADAGPHALLYDRWGLAIEWLAELLDIVGRTEESFELWPQAIERVESGVSMGGGSADVSYRLAVMHFNWGCQLMRVGRVDEAEPLVFRAEAMLLKVNEEYPEVIEYLRAIAESQSVCAHLHDLRGRTAEAREGFERAIATLDRIVAGGPDAALHRRELAVGLHNRAEFYRTQGELERSIADLERAVEAVDTEGTLSGITEEDRMKCTWPVVALAGVYIDAVRLTEGLALLERVELAFGDGWRCVAGEVHRMSPAAASGGTLVFQLDPLAHELAGILRLGTSWNFQALYRDPGSGGEGFNLTDGTSVTFR